MSRAKEQGAPKVEGLLVMQLCCGIRLQLSEQIIPAQGSQGPLPNGGTADKAGLSEMIMEQSC